MRMRDGSSEAGYTMIMTTLAMSLIMTLAVVAVAAVNGDTNQQTYDLSRKQAYEAAKAGVEDYSFQLKANSTYWEKCATVTEPSAVNQVGSTTKRRPVPGSTTAKYAIELLPAENQTSTTPYTSCSTSNPQASMLEASGSLVGSFRIRSTGFAAKSKVSLVATFKRPSFLDYVYFTQFETSDPIIYASSSWLKAAYERCERTIQEGRYSTSITGSSGKYCNVISFINGEEIDGPLHTNDAFVVCGSPVFGRTAADSIEVGASSPGWYWGASSSLGSARLSSNNCGTANPTFKGTFKTNSPNLEPPSTNGELSTIAQSAFRYTGQVRICLSGTTMKVSYNGTCDGSKYSGAIPSNGVVYVFNGTCSTAYTPFTATYPSTSGCGNAVVSGSYSGALTIAAENDIVVRESLNRSGNGLLGLIANNFVRVFHNYPSENADTCHGDSDSSDDDEDEQYVKNINIDAAMLAINHSFIVDHYDCGSDLGTLTVEGAIAQKFRGPVGTFSGGSTASGYSKNYEYDDRLRYIEPPSFLDPVTKSWVIGRETQG
jgi:hypothetical protein